MSLAEVHAGAVVRPYGWHVPDKPVEAVKTASSLGAPRVNPPPLNGKLPCGSVHRLVE